MRYQQGQLLRDLDAFGTLKHYLPSIVQAAVNLQDLAETYQRTFVSLRSNALDQSKDINSIQAIVEASSGSVAKKDLILPLLDICRGALIDRDIIDDVWTTETTVLYGQTPPGVAGSHVDTETNKWPADVQNAVKAVDQQMEAVRNVDIDRA